MARVQGASMRRRARIGPHCGLLTPSGLGMALLALFAFGCSRLGPGELGDPSVVLLRWTPVGEIRVGRTHAEYELRAECMSAGGAVSGVAALVVSTSPATTVLEDQIRCGPIAERSSTPTLDTITIRQDRTLPFSPRSLTGVALVWGPETQESETRADRVHFDYGYYAYLENGLGSPVDVVATVESRSASTVILDDRVEESGLESLRRRGSTDRFSFRHDRSVAFDPTALVWTLAFGGTQRPGFVAGEVYDDATGRALAGVVVQLQDGGTTTTDGEGAYQLPGAGLAVLGFTRDGYTPAWREARIPGGGVATPLDVRLRPRAPAAALTARDGGQLANGTTTLDVPVASLRADAAVSLTALGAQALPAPLPLGWAPIAGFEIETGGVPLGTPMALSLPGVVHDAERDVAVRFDAETRRWLRTELESAGGARVPIANAGAVVLARRDLVPASPPLPEIGSALEGVAAVSVPDDSTAELLPSPRVLFAASDARADVRTVLRTPAPLPSGTPIRVDFAERYARLDAATVEPPPMAQDLLLYPGAEGPEAAFVATPSAAIEPASLREGTIDLAANARDAITGARVLDGAGGTLTNGALALDVPSGALGAAVVATLAPFAPLDPTLIGDTRLAVLGGAAVDLGGATLAAPARLTLPLPEGADVGDDLLVVVAPRTVLGATRWELVGRARVEGDMLVVESSTDPPLPGVRAGDRYAVVRLLVPAGFVAGAVQDAAGAPATDAVVSVDTLPFVGRTEPGDPRYAVAAAVGGAQIEGLELQRGDAAALGVPIPDRGAVVPRDLSLLATRPRVVSIEPPDGATDVPTLGGVTVRFDRPMDAATVAAGSVALSANGVPVAATTSLATDRRTLTMRPSGPLLGRTPHTLRLPASVSDAFGRPIDGNQPDGSFASGFTTAAVGAPPRPPAGQISLSIPRDGTTEIEGTAGTAQPGDLVTAFDVTSGTSVSVIAGADGAFSIVLPAAIADRVELSIRDALGRETRFDPGPFTDPDGSVVVGRAGATVPGAGGVVATVPPGVVPDGTVMRISALAPDSAQAPVPGFLSLVTGVLVEMGDVVATDEIDVSLPLPPGHGFDPAVEWVMLEERDFFGEPRFAVVNVAHVRGDSVETASPPFPGVRRSGKYLLGPPNVPVGIVSALMSAAFVPSILFLAGASIDLIASGNFFPLFVVPLNEPFTITVFNGPADPVLTLPFGALVSPGLQQIAIPAPDDGSPFAADVLLPADEAEGVLGAVTLLAVFNKELDEPNVDANFRLLELPAQTPVAGQIEVLEVDGVKRAVRFKPARRLRFDTEYRMALQDICPFGALQGATCSKPLTTPDPTFRTFAAQRLAAVTVGDPNDVAAWAPSPDRPTDRVVVANGTLQNADQTGVVVVDVSDPAAPAVLSERPITGRTLGVLALDDARFANAAGSTVASGPTVLAVSGGIDVSSNLRILRPLPPAPGPPAGLERAALESVGASLLSTSNAALQNGIVLADVPPFVGTPRGVAFLPGNPNGAAYVAMIGVGLQAVNTQNTAGTVRVLPGLFSMASIAAVDTLGTLVLAGDRNRLHVLTPQLEPVGSLAIPVRALDTVRAFTADLDLDGVIDPANEAFDLAFVVEDATQKLSIVDLTNPGTPALLAAIPLGRSARDVAVDPIERLAYVGDDQGIQIVDVSNPLEAVGLLDANGDGRDDRLLGRVGGATASRTLALDRSGTHGYSGSSATGELETLFLNPGRLFVDHFDPEFPGVRLDDSDYYPNLGAKRIHVRAFELDGLPGSGEVRAQRVAGPSNVAIEASVSLTGGVATFTMAGPDHVLPREGPLTFEFRWTDSTGATVVTRETYEIRNNSVTNLEEVMSGRAVFVATIETGRDHDGITPRPLEPIDPGYDPTPRPRSFAPLAERRWDFVQEMLNQTLGRKLSAWQARPFPNPPLVEEDGIYFAERDGEMLGFAKQQFAIRVNTQPDDRTPTFRKLMKDYGIAGAAQTAMHDRIVDAETLRMTTLRVQPDRTQPCTQCDVAINTAGGGDTGLYELYTNVTFRFIEDMAAEGERYRDESTPANAEGRWRYREFRNGGVGVPPAPGDDASRYDGRPGTAYTYGGKQSLEEFESTVSAFSGPTLGDISILFPDYRGNLLDLTPPGVVDAAGSERWIGLESSELALSSSLAYFESRHWSGIDCSGFVQRIAAAAADRNPASALPGFVTSRNESRCAGVAANGVGLCPLVTITQGAGAGYASGTLKSTFAFNDFTPGFSRGTANIWTRYLGGLGFAVHRGDLMAGPGHIAFIYSTPSDPTSDYYLLHAYGMTTYAEGLVPDRGRRARETKNGMKVLTSGWKGHFNGHAGAVRPLLWQ